MPKQESTEQDMRRALKGQGASEIKVIYPVQSWVNFVAAQAPEENIQTLRKCHHSLVWAAVLIPCVPSQSELLQCWDGLGHLPCTGNTARKQRSGLE